MAQCWQFARRRKEGEKTYTCKVVVPPEHMKGGCLDIEYYAEKTLLGRWMRHTVGIDVDNPQAVLACIKILCQVALKHIDGKGELI